MRSMNNTKSAIEPRNSAKKKLKSSKNKLNSKKKAGFLSQYQTQP